MKTTKYRVENLYLKKKERIFYIDDIIDFRDLHVSNSKEKLYRYILVMNIKYKLFCDFK